MKKILCILLVGVLLVSCKRTVKDKNVENTVPITESVTPTNAERDEPAAIAVNVSGIDNEKEIQGLIRVQSGETVELGSIYAAEPSKKTILLVKSSEYPDYSFLQIGDCISAIPLIASGELYIAQFDTAERFVIVPEDNYAGYKAVNIFWFNEGRDIDTLALIGRLNGELESLDHNVITTYGRDTETFAGANVFRRHKEYVLAVGDVAEKERVALYGNNAEYFTKDGVLKSDYIGTDEQRQFWKMILVPAGTAPIGQIYKTLSDIEIKTYSGNAVKVPRGSYLTLLATDDRGRLEVMVLDNIPENTTDSRGYLEYYFSDGEMRFSSDMSFESVFGGKGW